MIKRLFCVRVLLAGSVAFTSATDARAADAPVATVLQAHRWTLQSASDGAGRPIDALVPAGQRVVMEFDGSRLSVRGSCNQMSGAWRLGYRGEFVVGRLAGTMKACDALLMQADEALSAALATPMSIGLTPGASPTLRLSTPTHQTLTFAGKPTLRSLYGQPTRLFLEVAPQTVDCTLPSGGAGSCLQVREVSFDAQGLRKEPPGPWRSLAEPIEGYAHTPGMRNVLRIDRYERRPAPAGGTTALYVLDMVVESASVGSK